MFNKVNLRILNEEFINSQNEKLLHRKLSSYRKKNGVLEDPDDTSNLGVYLVQRYMERPKINTPEDILRELPSFKEKVQNIIFKKMKLTDVLAVDPKLANELKERYRVLPEQTSRLLPLLGKDHRTRLLSACGRALPTSLDVFYDMLDESLTNMIKGLLYIPRIKSESFYKAVAEGNVKNQQLILVENLFVIKFPEKKQYDEEILQEAVVGFQINKLCDKYPNFARTYGLVLAEPPPSLKQYGEKEYLCYMSEHINGVPLHRFKRKHSYETLYVIFMQLWLALDASVNEIGFTHFDLHAGNVIVIELKHQVTIQYPRGSIKTKYIAKMIDWGRSHALDDHNNHLGRTHESWSMYNKADYFYDCYFVFERTLYRNEGVVTNKLANHILDFFGIDHPDGNIYHDMKSVTSRKYNMEKWFDLIFGKACPKEALPYVSRSSLEDRTFKGSLPDKNINEKKETSSPDSGIGSAISHGVERSAKEEHGAKRGAKEEHGAKRGARDEHEEKWSRNETGKEYDSSSRNEKGEEYGAKRNPSLYEDGVKRSPNDNGGEVKRSPNLNEDGGVSRSARDENGGVSRNEIEEHGNLTFEELCQRLVKPNFPFKKEVVQKQIALEESRIQRLVKIQGLLTSKVPLYPALKFVNPNIRKENVLDESLNRLETIARQSQSQDMRYTLDMLLAIYRNRVTLLKHF